jgi:plastocyanin
MHARPVFIVALLAFVASAGLADESAPSRAVVISVSMAGFSPRSATIVAGMRVRFTVRDHKNHQLRMKLGAPSGVVPPTVLHGQGASVTVMPTSLGSYVYVDSLNSARPEFSLIVAG